MSDITRFDPLNELARLEPFDEDIVRSLALRPLFWPLEQPPQMRLDLAESDKAYTVKAEIPGAEKSAIRVSIDGNHVSIGAEVKEEKTGKDGRTLIRHERHYGSLSRSLTLEQAVDADRAQAKYENGVLELTLPKKPGTGISLLPIS